MRVVSLLCIFLICLSLHGRENDTIILIDGREYHGILEHINQDSLKFIAENEVMNIELAKVRMILPHKEINYRDIERVEELPLDYLTQTFQKLQATTADEDTHIIVGFEKSRYEYTNEGVEFRYTIVFKVNNQAGLDYTATSFMFDTINQQAFLEYAFAIQSDGSLAHIKDVAINREPVHNNETLYDRQMRFKFSLPTPHIGSIYAYEYVIKSRKESIQAKRLATRLYVQDSFPVLQRQVEVIGFPYRIQTAIQKGETKNKYPSITCNPRRFFAEIRNIEGIPINEEHTLPFEHLYGSLIIVGSQNNQIIIRQLHQALSEVVVDAQDWLKHAAVRCDGSLEDQRKAYHFLAMNKKLASATAMTTEFTPATGELLLQADRLSLFDKSVLMKKYYDQVNIESHIFFYDKEYQGGGGLLPSFGRAGLMVKEAGRTHYLFFEEGYNGFFATPSYLINQPIFIANKTKLQRATIKKQEIAENKKNSRYYIAINQEGNASMKIEQEFEGPRSEKLRKLKQLPREEQEKIIVEDIQKIKLGSRVNSFDIFEKDIPQQMNMSMLIESPSFLIPSGRLALFYLPELQETLALASSPTRKWTFLQRRPHIYSMQFEIEIPDNYQILSIPPNKKLQYQGFSYQIAWLEEHGDNAKILRCVVESRQAEVVVKPQKYARFVKFVQERAVASSIPVILEQLP